MRFIYYEIYRIYGNNQGMERKKYTHTILGALQIASVLQQNTLLLPHIYVLKISELMLERKDSLLP